MLWSIVLFLVGFYLGILIMCILAMAKKGDEDEADD